MKRRLLYILVVAVIFSGCVTRRMPKFISEAVLYSMDSIAADPKSEMMIAPYRKKLEEEMRTVIGHLEVAMPKVKGEPETVLGNFIADLVLEQTKIKTGISIDACLLNTGGLRTSLPKGEVTRGNIFELMPFENELVVAELPGEVLKEMFENIAAYGGHPIANMRMSIRNGQPEDMTIGGMAPEMGRTYRIATSDYLANGGDNMKFFGKALHLLPTGYKLRDCIIDYFLRREKEGAKNMAELDGRIRLIQQ